MFSVENKKVVILEVSRANYKPVQFSGQEYIRVGTYKKKLKEYPEKERALWRIFDQTPFENLPAAEKLSDGKVLELLDYPHYFDLLGLYLPENRIQILNRLRDDDFIACNGTNWTVLNIAAVLFAKRMEQFKHLKRKTVRIIVYKENTRLETLKEYPNNKGYATGFEELITFINNLLPSKEIIGQALRKNEPMYPELCIRELVANCLIHQDFTITGTGPMIEIFSDRIEITNPGVPLVKTERFLDSPPKSRNDAIASFLRRIGICEERGSGIDKVVYQTELNQLPAPLIEVTNEHTRVTLFSYRPLNALSKEEKVRACYLHACLKYVNREYMTNTSLRQRFGIEEHNSAVASRIIRDTLTEKVIKRFEKGTSRKYAKYVPFWAV